MILERPFPTLKILQKRTKGRKRRRCKGKETGKIEEEREDKRKKGRKKEEMKKKKYQAAEELDLLSPLAPCHVFLDSGESLSLTWNVV